MTRSCPDCSDGLDNDGDGLIDYPDDGSCASAEEDDEASFLFGKALVGTSFAALSAGEKRAVQHLLWYAPVTVTKLRAYLDGNGGGTGTADGARCDLPWRCPRGPGGRDRGGHDHFRAVRRLG